MSAAWLAFGAGLVIGGAGACFVMALCMAAGDADRQAESRLLAEDLGADEVYCMLSNAGGGDIKQGKR